MAVLMVGCLADELVGRLGDNLAVESVAHSTNMTDELSGYQLVGTTVLTWVAN